MTLDEVCDRKHKNLQVDIDQIAHHLERIKRFRENGHLMFELAEMRKLAKCARSMDRRAIVLEEFIEEAERQRDLM